MTPPKGTIVDDTEDSKCRAGVSLAVTLGIGALSAFGSYFTWGTSQEHRITKVEEAVEQLREWRKEQREDFKSMMDKLDKAQHKEADDDRGR